MLTYTELMAISTYEERLEYLRLDSIPAEYTFGTLRKLNQKFYNSREWKIARTQIIGRDLGWDLAVPGRHILGRVIVHHLNPLTPNDFLKTPSPALAFQNLITVSHDTHLAIHFGYQPEILPGPNRFEGDTKLW